ncbi:MAG: hypothetical protein L0I62_09220 [Gammaproteobacteria bacterium]|nr:hypothetical protein [Gammaproteobacteria bacterium]
MNRRVDPRLLSRLGLVVVLVATALLYWPGTRGGFLLDDYPNIVDNPAMQSVSLSAADMWRVVESTQSGPTGRPIAMMSFALNAHFSGLSPQAMKVTNLVIHLVNGLLVFLFLRLLLGEYARLRAGRREEESRACALPPVAGAESAGGSELARDSP